MGAVLALIGSVFADPGARRVAVVFGLCIAIAFGFYLAGRSDGAETVTRGINNQNERAENTAEAAERDVAACIGRGGFWDVTTGACR